MVAICLDGSRTEPNIWIHASKYADVVKMVFPACRLGQHPRNTHYILFRIVVVQTIILNDGNVVGSRRLAEIPVTYPINYRVRTGEWRTMTEPRVSAEDVATAMKVASI